MSATFSGPPMFIKTTAVGLRTLRTVRWPTTHGRDADEAAVASARVAAGVVRDIARLRLEQAAVAASRAAIVDRQVAVTAQPSAWAVTSGFRECSEQDERRSRDSADQPAPFDFRSSPLACAAQSSLFLACVSGSEDGAAVISAAHSAHGRASRAPSPLSAQR